MTDAEDQARSAYGPHIDFAAPGWDIYSTTTNSVYQSDSGTSYSTPLLAGIAAWIMSINPALGPAEIEAILTSASIDLEHLAGTNIMVGDESTLPALALRHSRLCP